MQNLQELTNKKKRLDSLRPLAPAQLRNLEEWYKVELTYTSNAIEGNTLTRQETALVVEKGITVEGKSLQEHLEAKNHAEALDFVKTLVGTQRQEITEKNILDLHGIILHGIDDPNAGRYRNVPVRIAGTQVPLPNWVKVPDLMAEFVAWIQSENDDHPALIAAEAHYRLVTIHPFVDGNGRTARLLMNLILMQAGYPPAIIRPEDRRIYINSLEKAQMGGSKDDYYNVILTSVDRSLDVYLNEEETPSIPIHSPIPGQALVRRSELAALTGLRPSTIKYYTEIGLLPYDQSDARLSRYYNRSEAVERLQHIDELKAQGLSMEDIKTRLVGQ